jgi:hypothetical protein
VTSLTCPKCRQAVSDEALDAGQCPACGYDGPMVALAPAAKWAWLVATLMVVGGGAALGGYLLFPAPPRPAPGPEVAAIIPPGAVHIPPKHVEPAVIAIAPPPRLVPPASPPTPPKKEPQAEPVPVASVPPKKDLPRFDPPVGPVVRINLREVREQKLDRPRGIVAVADMNLDDRLTLTGRVRLLKIGTVGGKAVLDASGLEAEEVVITGDLNKNAVVKLNAPGGRVTISGHVTGNARLAVNAPGGEVIAPADPARFDHGCEVTVVAKRVEIGGLMTGGSKLLVTLTAGGSLKLGRMDDEATVIYKRSAPTDPAPTVETGELRGGAKVQPGT